MTATTSMLRSAVAFLRQARRALRRNDTPAAFQAFSLARHDLGFAIGAASPIPPSCERVRRCVAAVEDQLYFAIRALAWRAAPADPGALAVDIAAGIAVLRTRDGMDEITDKVAAERGRCIAMGIYGNFDVRELLTAPEVTHIGQVAGIPQDAKRGCGMGVTGGAR